MIMNDMNKVATGTAYLHPHLGEMSRRIGGDAGCGYKG